MNIIKNIISIFNRLFTKKEDIKMISEQVKVEEKNIDSFINSLKKNVVKTKRKVECLICEGDGLGIQKKIDY